MFIDEFCAIVDLIVDNNKKIFLGVVLSNILVGVLLVRHFEYVVLFFQGKKSKQKEISIAIAC